MAAWEEEPHQARLWHSLETAGLSAAYLPTDAPRHPERWHVQLAGHSIPPCSLEGITGQQLHSLALSR